MIFGINTTRDISKLSQISLAWRLVKLRITISKYHSWYLCQISLQIMLLPTSITPDEPSLFSTSTGNSRGLQLSLVFGDLFSCRPPNTRQKRPLLAGNTGDSWKRGRQSVMQSCPAMKIISLFLFLLFSLFLHLIYNRDIFTGLFKKIWVIS